MYGDRIRMGLFLMALPILCALAGCGGNDGNPAGSEDQNNDDWVYRVVTDIPYLEGSDFDKQKLDLYTATDPNGGPPNKVIFFVPGGAWRQGDKSAYAELGETLARYHHFTVAVINYRLSNEDDGAAVHPMHVQDVAGAFAWVKAHVAEYGGDPSRIYAFGQSAGAHLVSLLSTDGSYLEDVGCALSDIKGLIAMSGAYDLPRLAQYPANLYGLTGEEALMFKYILLDAFGGWDDATLEPASPAHHATVLSCPALIVYVDQDLPGFPDDAVHFSGLIEEAGGDADLEHLTRADFSDEAWATADSLAALEPAFEEYVGHYAELVAINTATPTSVSAMLVVNFISRH